MGDFSSMSRENKKKQLKRRVISSDSAPVSIKGRVEDSQEVVQNARRRVVRRRMAVAGVLAVVLGIGALVFYHYERFHQYTAYKTLWENNLEGEDAVKSEGNVIKYVSFGDCVLRYTKDGASYIDAEGRIIWMKSYEMKSPIVAVNGEFAAIADQQGNSIYICDKSGCQGIATTLLPIVKVAVSAKGVVAAILQDSKAGYIKYFKKDGSALDITIMAKLSGDGFPLDLSLSPDGTQLMCSFAYLSKGSLQCKVVYYNFELGKNDPSRIVGGFNEAFKDSMVARVHFLDETWSCAFSSNGLTFFSTKVLNSPELVKQIEIEEEIRSICYTDTYVGVVVGNNQGQDAYRIDVYRFNGDKVFSKNFNYQYRYVDIDGDMVLLYNDNSCKVLNMKGVEKFYAEFDFIITKVSKGRFFNSLILMGPQMMKEIKLQ